MRPPRRRISLHPLPRPGDGLGRGEPDRQGTAGRGDRHRGPRPALPGPGPAPQRGRQPLRGRGGHGAGARAGVRAPSRRPARSGRSTCSGPGGPALRPGDGQRAGGLGTASHCCAAVTRAWTSGWPSTWSTASCRSATTCWPAARWRPSPWSKRSPGWSPGVMGNLASRRGGELHRRAARVPAVHQAGGLPGLGSAGRAPVRPPRACRAVEKGGGARPHVGAPARPHRRAGAGFPRGDGRLLADWGFDALTFCSPWARPT